MSDNTMDAVIGYLKQVYTPADLRKLALKLVPSLDTGNPTGQPWDQFNILRTDVVLVLGANLPGGQCIVCGAAVQTGPAATIHAAYHNRADRRQS